MPIKSSPTERQTFRDEERGSGKEKREKNGDENNQNLLYVCTNIPQCISLF